MAGRGTLVQKIIEAGADVENLKRLGYLTEESAQNPRAVKSAQTKYAKSVEASKAKQRRELAAIDGETVVKQQELRDRPIVRPEDIENTVLVAHKGDVTGTNVTLEKLSGLELETPVTSYGGPNFPRVPENFNDQLYWASMKSAATPLQNKAETLEQAFGMPVTAVYTSMGREGNFFNQAFADALLQKTITLKPSKESMAKFDEMVRKFRPDWVGISNPKARDQLMGTGEFPMEGAGKLRSIFVKEIQKAAYRDQGFATIGRLESVLTDPDLVGAMLGDSGYTMGRIGGDYGLKAITSHPSYNTGIMGEYIGGLQRTVPPNIMFPDAWEKLSKELTKPKAGGTPQPLNYAQMVDALSKRKDLFQIADARWVDSVSTWLEKNPGKNMKAAITALGLPAVALAMLSPEQSYAETIDAINASVDGELTEDQAASIRGYIQMTANQASEPMTPMSVVDPAQIDLDPVPNLAIPEFAQDNVTGKILDARQSSDLTPAQKARMRMEKEKEGKTIGEMAAGAAETAGAVAGDIFGGIVEAPRQALAGFLDATAEMAEIMESIIPLGGEPIKIEAQPRTITGAGVRAISQFLTGFLPAMKGLKAAGVSHKVSPLLAGAFADAAGFDAHEARLSDLVQTVPELQNPVTEYLQSDPNDSEAEGRFKNAVEGLLLGGAVEGLVKAVKFVRARKAAKETAAAAGVTVGAAIQSDEQLAKELATIDTIEQEFIPFQEQAANNSVEFEFQTGSTKADPEAANNINLSNIQTTDDVNRLIEMVAEADAPNINAARREKITNDELPKLADDLGMTVQDLLNRRQGQAFNAEQILAARKILIASGENLIKLSKKAATGGDLDLALFRRAMAQHQAIQQQVSGMTAEAGRALQSFNIIAASSREQERLIKEALEASGGMEVNQKMAQMMSELDDPTKLGKFVKDASKARNIDMLYEVWINGLLSSPTTHMVNVLSNTMVAALTVGERKVASMIGSNIPAGEAGAQLKGMVDGARDGMRLAWQALKTGEPTDVLEKVEVDKHRAISGESLELSGTAGRLADYLGEAVRIPGRLLTTGDAFFKAVGYRMELHAQAYRQAFNEGLRDEAAAKRVLELVDNPPENIKMAAIDASRYQTFTNQLGPAGKAVENLRNKMPYARVIMPFVRTPVNIMSYTFERTPLAPLSASFREEIAAGGARRDLALGKLIMGSTVMAVAADLTLSGHLTGAGPTDRDAKNILRATGWQPYSVKVGDTYYAYNRLDPTGALLGLAADMAEIMGQTTDAEAQQIAAAAALSVAQNMASKTYMSGVVDFMDAFFSSSTDPEANNYKLNSWLSRMAGSIVPSSIANIERVMSPEMSATYSMLDKIKSRIPGYSDTLPPRRNIFGEPVVLEGGIGPDIMSPIYTSTAKDDPIADELVKQQASISMPRRVINNVELDAQQYDKYILLYSGQDNKGMKGVPLKKKLKELFATPQYKNATDGPEGGKSLLIQSVFTAYRDTAKAQLISEDPRLEGDIMTLKRERIEKLTGR